MSTRIPLDLIEVEKPCPKDWNRMRGSDEKRFCDHCNRDVYDLGALSEADVQNLLCEQAGKLCVRFTRLADGKIQTLDYCQPSGRKGYGWRFWAVICAVAAALGFVVLGKGTTKVMGGPRPFVIPPPPTTNPSPQSSPCQTP
jgi:hypothetical protein